MLCQYTLIPNGGVDGNINHQQQRVPALAQLRACDTRLRAQLSALWHRSRRLPPRLAGLRGTTAVNVAVWNERSKDSPFTSLSAMEIRSQTAHSTLRQTRCVCCVGQRGSVGPAHRPMDGSSTLARTDMHRQGHAPPPHGLHANRSLCTAGWKEAAAPSHQADPLDCKTLQD